MTINHASEMVLCYENIINGYSGMRNYIIVNKLSAKLLHNFDMLTSYPVFNDMNYAQISLTLSRLCIGKWKIQSLILEHGDAQLLIMIKQINTEIDKCQHHYYILHPPSVFSTIMGGITIIVICVIAWYSAVHCMTQLFGS